MNLFSLQTLNLFYFSWEIRILVCPNLSFGFPFSLSPQIISFFFFFFHLLIKTFLSRGKGSQKAELVGIHPEETEDLHVLIEADTE